MMPSNDYGFLITVINKITKPQNTATARPFRTKSLIDDFSSASTELSHLHWIDINDVKSLNLPFITEVVLNEVKEIIKDGPNKKGVPFFKHGASSDFIFIT